MDQPRTNRGRAAREAIVIAAARLMYERGIRSTSLDAILAAAGAGKSQFYHYFKDKDDLAAAVLDYQLSTVLGELTTFRVDTWSGLRDWFDALIEGQSSRRLRGCPVGSLTVEMSAISDEMADRVTVAFARWHVALDEAFRTMRSSGRLVADAHPEELATATLAQIQGGYLLSSASRDIAPMRQALDAAYKNLRSYAAVRSPRRARG